MLRVSSNLTPATIAYLAQLVERILGMDKVMGSNPVLGSFPFSIYLWI